MDLKEVRKLVKFAKANGIQTISLGDVHITFKADEIPSGLHKNPESVQSDLIKKTAGIVATVTGENPAPVKEAKLAPAPDPVPGLDDINKFIYEDLEEEAEHP